MKRGLKLVVTWLFIVSVFAGFIPGTLPVSSAAASNELIWPNPGAVNLTKTAEPTGTQGQWKVTLTVEGKNIQSTSDVVLVMDRSGSMDGSRMTKAKEAAKKFVDNLLIKDSKTRIAFVSFGEGVTTESDFQGTAGKESLKTKINGISASGGTNIQAGINRARTLLNGSQAQNKVIVLLSDGEPTYSYKAGKATAYNWPDNKFKFALSDFDYSKQLGSGDDYALSEGFFGIGKETYKVNGFDVKNNGIGTISEAKLAKDGGIGIYSIGLEVGDSANAKYVLNNTQNKGYYESSSSELNKVFTELSSKISYAAQNARVIDPMGAKFDKIDGPTVSQGTTSWDSKSETITWEIGNIVEGSPATMSYIVKMDNDADPNVLYPTNKVTTMSYTDVNGKSTSKNFIVPEVSFGKGSITVRGYSVNADGLPINADGVVVEKPELAEQLYNEPFIVNGKPALDINKPYDVTAKAVDGYQLNVGTSPTSVQLTTKAPSPTIWFGYVKAPKVPYTLKVVYKAGDNVLEQSEPINILQGEAVDYSSKEFVGYLFKNVELSPIDSGLTSKDGHVTGKMPNKNVTITFNYEAIAQTVTVKHMEKGTTHEIKEPTTQNGVTGQTIALNPVKVDGYTASSENDYSYKFTADADQERTLFYTANTQTVTVKHVDKATNNVITTTTRTGVAGESITLEPEIISGYTASSENDYSYKFTADADQERTLFYTANTQTVTVKHVDKATNNVITTTTRTGVAGESITLEPEIISGYTASSENDYSYKFTADADQERTLLYTKNAPDLKRFVTVNYINLVTNLPLIDPIIREGVVGDILRAEPITVGDAVYTPDESNVDYVITDELKQSTSFYYILKNAVDQQQVLVKYLELGTDAELGNDVVFGKQGATITHIPPSQITVTDAVYTPESPTYSITFTGEPDQEFLIYYSKDGTPVDQYQHVTVKYHLQGTNTQVAEPTKASGIVGSTISLKAISIPGYTAVKSTDTFQVGDNEGQEYIFYYTKNTPVDPNPGTPSNPSTSTPTPLPPAPPVVAPLPPAPPTLEKENHYNYINGYPDGTIKPENRISREEVAAIFYRLMDDETRSSYLKNDSSYGDVEGSRWSNKHIATMENAGIITGYPDGTFKPGRQITRAEFAAIASRFDNLDEQENTLFSDIKDHWAAKYIVSAANKGWIKGYPDGTFKPNQYITRAEAMAFINSVLNRKTRVPGIHEDAKAWPDNNIAKWYYTEVLEATNHHDYSRNEDGSETWTEVKSDRVYP
ncbi:VWA domain-containing protein [Paenibacillus anaericanus]|uniref:VWA domain-containing protein n=1 Tax=Paenibacillus anaericanus TaxID=170367 RepID=A0A433YBL0_9BACL|nr:S-layer homology domain-containing protein [Paenibacillus anaericanus]RUT47267.1 VWA domain-containing protein [Paenibacillus anaericanus]